MISDYLARRDVATIGPTELLVLMGSAVLESVRVTADAYHAGHAPRILISGGIGHSTHHLEQAAGVSGQPESHIFRDLMITRYDVPAAVITVEDQSTNCGENADFTRRLVDRPTGLLLIQDPTMQRRTHASFVRAFRDLPGTTLTSFAPLIPWIGPDHVSAGPGRPPIWSRTRFTSLLLGEIRRLRDDADGYGPRGRDYIDHIDIPEPVLAAYERLAAEHPELVRAPGA